MRIHRSRLLGAAAAIALAALSLLPLGPFQLFELKALDLRFRLRDAWRKPVARPEVVTVLLDDASLAALGHRPVPYSAYTTAIERLDEAGARVVGLDVLLAPADPTHRREVADYERFIAVVSGPRNTVLAADPTMPGVERGPAWVASRDGSDAWPCADQASRAADVLPGWDLLASEVSSSARRLGHAMLSRDDDGVVRRVPLLVREGDRCVPSFALQVVCAMQQVAPEEVLLRSGRIDIERNGQLLHRIPLDTDGRLVLDPTWSQRHAAVLSLASLVGAQGDGGTPVGRGSPQAPAAGVSAGGLAAVRGRPVLVGASARALGHFHSTPLAPLVPDVDIQASAVETILRGSYLRFAPRAAQFAVNALFLLAAAWLLLRLPPWRGVLVGLGLMVLYVAFEKAFFIWGGLCFDFIGPMVALQAAVIGFPLCSYRHRSLRMLREMSALRRFDDLVLATMTSGLAVVDETGRIVKSNAHAARLLGLETSNLEGRPVTEVFAASPTALVALRQVTESPGRRGEGPACRLPLHVPVILEAATPDGDRILDLSVSALDAAERPFGGEGRCYLLTFADVSERLRVLQEDERSERLAAIGEIAAKLGHEIRNSLGGIRLYVENVREEIDPQGAAGSAIDGMVDEIESLYRKIDELREYARDPILEKGPCDLKQVVEEAITYAGQPLRDKHIQVVIEAEPHLEPAVADRRQLRAAFTNLVHNAADAAPEGGSLRIGIQRAASGNGVPAGHFLVHFEDNGPGIPPEIGEQVFSLFFTTKAESGTGLGLPIVKKIVEGHGGRVTFESVPGRTRFTVMLPPAQRGESAT